MNIFTLECSNSDSAPLASEVLGAYSSLELAEQASKVYSKVKGGEYYCTIRKLELDTIDDDTFNKLIG